MLGDFFASSPALLRGRREWSRLNNNFWRIRISLRTVLSSLICGTIGNFRRKGGNLSADKAGSNLLAEGKLTLGKRNLEIYEMSGRVFRYPEKYRGPLK